MTVVVWFFLFLFFFWKEGRHAVPIFVLFGFIRFVKLFYCYTVEQKCVKNRKFYFRPPPLRKTEFCPKSSIFLKNHSISIYFFCNVLHYFRKYKNNNTVGNISEFVNLLPLHGPISWTPTNSYSLQIDWSFSKINELLQSYTNDKWRDSIFFHDY